MIRACVPKLELGSTFEQKNEIAKPMEEEFEKVPLCSSIIVRHEIKFNILLVMHRQCQLMNMI